MPSVIPLREVHCAGESDKSEPSPGADNSAGNSAGAKLVGLLSLARRGNFFFWSRGKIFFGVFISAKPRSKEKRVLCI